jgi:hypothetical protein
MRGYHRPRNDLQPLVTPSKSREQIAADIAAGNPPPVEYSTRPGEPLPVHLRRARLMGEPG